MAIIRLIVSLSFFAALTHAQTPDSEAMTARMLGATHVAPVFFDPGVKALNTQEKTELQNFLSKIRQSDTIESVKVLVWADREYPKKLEKASAAQVDLAKVRAEAIKEYLLKEMKVDSVETHNMAQRPSKLSEIFKTEDYKVKKSAENSGAAPKKDEIGFFEEMGRSTTALVMVVVKEKTVSSIF